MPLPPAHFFVGAGAAELARGRSSQQAWRAWLVGGAFGVLPDIDTGIGVLLGRSTEFHGIFTHTPLAVLTVGLLVWAVAGRRWAIVATAAYAAHLLLDLFEDRASTSVQPLWPLSDETLPSLARILPSVPWRRGGGPEQAAVSLFDPGVFGWLMAQTAAGAVLFLLALLIRRVLGAR